MLNRIYWMLRTWYWRSRHAETASKKLNSRATVSNYLRDYATGKQATLTRAQALQLAQLLDGEAA